MRLGGRPGARTSGAAHLVALGLVAVAAEHGGTHSDTRHERQCRRRRRQSRPVRRRRWSLLAPLPRQAPHAALWRLIPRLRTVPAAQGARFPLSEGGRSNNAHEPGLVHNATDRQLADASLHTIAAVLSIPCLEQSLSHCLRGTTKNKFMNESPAWQMSFRMKQRHSFTSTGHSSGRPQPCA